MQRRLRLETVRVDMARMPLDLYAAADAEVIAALLCHKILLSMATEGLGESCLLLQDWLTILTSRYNENTARRREPSALNVTFSKHANMTLIPRLVYGMLRGRLLDPVLVSRDDRAFISYLCESLNPEALTLVMYPKLEAFASIHDKLPLDSSSSLPLSIQSLSAAAGTIFILDAYTELSVFYTTAASEQFAFPPPPDCALRAYIQQIKETRSICPHVYYSQVASAQQSSSGSCLLYLLRYTALLAALLAAYCCVCCAQAGQQSSSDLYSRLIDDAAASLSIAPGQSESKEWAGAASKGNSSEYFSLPPSPLPPSLPHCLSLSFCLSASFSNPKP